MVDVDKAVIARLRAHGHTFEVLVDCDKALALKGGKDIPMDEVLAVERVYSDAHKGLITPVHDFKDIFKTEDPVEAAREIIKRGEVQQTIEYRHKLSEEKRRRIIYIIHQNGIDPRTGAPHPIQRIENAFEEAKVHVDQDQSAEGQLDEIIDKLRPILPIRFEKRQIAVKIDAHHAHKVYGTVRKYGSIIKEEWLSDGGWIGVVEIPAGLREDLMDAINAETHGSAEIKLVETH